MPYLNHLNNLDSGKIPGMMLWMSIPTAHHAHDIVRVMSLDHSSGFTKHRLVLVVGKHNA